DHSETASNNDMNIDQEIPDNQPNGRHDKHDLCESVKGLYRLLDLCKDEGSNGLVDKIIISKEYVEKICNEMVPNSYKSISKIRFEQLNSRCVHLVGCYGKNALIAKLLLREEQPVSTLRPGIYLQRLSSNDNDNYEEFPKFFVILWSEDGCYKDSASSYLKKNMTNLHRYLTKITTQQLCLMDDEDLEYFDWKMFKKEQNDATSEDEDDNLESEDICYDFEVKRSQEQKENFELFSGFDLRFSKLASQNSYSNESFNGQQLHPLVVESVSNQAFLTREMTIATKMIDNNIQSYNSLSQLQDYFKRKIETQKCALKFDRRRMTIEKLEILVKEVLTLPEFFEPYGIELDFISKEMIKQNEEFGTNLREDMNKIEQIAWQLLRKAYGDFEDKIDPVMETHNESINNISYSRWKDLKIRLLVAKHCFENQSSQASENQTISMFDIFLDKESDNCALIKKFTTEPKNYWLVDKLRTKATEVYTNYVQGSDSSEREIVREIKKNADNLPDHEFVHLIDYEKGDVVKKFLQEYRFWRNQIFPNKIKRIIESFKQSIEKNNKSQNEQNYKKKKREIEKKYFEEICTLIETKYPTGDLLMILNVERIEPRYGIGHASYRLHREIEIPRPSQLCLTIYSTQLSMSDTLEMDKDEDFIPQPIMHSYNRNYGVSFEIDPETYDFKHIAQLDKKFLLFLWNKVTSRLEIYFDIITRLQKSLKEQGSLKKLNPGQNFMIAVNEPKGLIAIYDNDKGV
ncbi:16012_t:CDS:10, partial [Cetraspora pellucida]